MADPAALETWDGEDVRLSDTILARLSEAYRKFRNTFRWALGNLSDFDFATDSVAPSEMHEMDLWVLSRTEKLVADCLAAVRVQADKKKIALKTDIPYPRPSIRGDALRLRQILINLLSNAVKFTEAGSVAVSLVCEADHSMSLVVTDTGIGMSPDEVTVALEPFGQIENAITKKYEGAGLGLPLAKRLVEIHGGQLIITSAKGKGTVIRAQLPADRVTWPVSVAAE